MPILIKAISVPQMLPAHINPREYLLSGSQRRHPNLAPPASKVTPPLIWESGVGVAGDSAHAGGTIRYRAVLEGTTKFQRLAQMFRVPRHSH